MANEGRITKEDLIKQDALDAFEELTLLIEKNLATTKKLTSATIKLNQARLKGGEATLRQERKVVKLQAEEVEGLKKINAQKTKAVGLEKKHAVAMRKSTSEIKKHTGALTKMAKVARAVSLAYFAIQHAIGQLAKMDRTLKMLDSMNFALQKITGSALEAAQLFEFVKKTADDFGVSLEVAGERFVKFYTAAKQSGLSMTATQQIFSDMSKAAGVLGLRTDEVQGVFLALEQMLSKGKVTTEELRRQLGERLPGAFGIMAKAVGVNVQELDEMLKKGEVLSAEVLPKFARMYNEAFGIDQVKKVETLAAASARMSNAYVQMIEDIETGTGGLKIVFEGFYIVMTDLRRIIGEWFLTVSEIQQKYSDIGAGSGRLLAGSTLSEMKAYYGEEKALMESRAKLYNQMIDLNKRIQFNRANGMAFDQDKENVLTKQLGEITRAYNLLGSVWKEMNEDPKKGDPLGDDDKKRPRAHAIDTLTTSTKGLIEEAEKLATWFERLAEAAQTHTEKDMFTRLAEGAKKTVNELKKLGNSSFDPEGAGLPEPKEAPGYDGMSFQEKVLLYEDEIDMAQQVTNELLAIGDALFDRKLEQIQAEIEATEDKYEKMYNLAEGDDVHQREIVRNREADLERLRAKELKIRQQQARWDKANAVFNILLNTAMAITRALGTPWLIAGVAAIGAAQLATVMATPVPQYKTGRKGGPAEWAIVGDGGKQEVIQTRNGAFLTPDKPTLTYLDKGDDVYSSRDAFAGSVVRSMRSTKTNFEDKRMIEDAIAKGFKKAKVNNYLKLPQVKVNVDHAVWAAKQKRF